MPPLRLNRRRVMGMLLAAPLLGGQLGSCNLRCKGKVSIAFCGHLLCSLPFLVARELMTGRGKNLELHYARGGAQAAHTLLLGQVDYAGISLDVCLNAWRRGYRIRRLNSHGQIPMFSLVTAPSRSQLRELGDLKGARVGLTATTSGDYVILNRLLAKKGISPGELEIVVQGPRGFEALESGLIDAAMLQEPAASRIKALGGREFFNALDQASYQKLFGGPYDFIGLTGRFPGGDERISGGEMVTIFSEALAAIATSKGEELARLVPEELFSGFDRKGLAELLDASKERIYSRDGKISEEASRAVLAAHGELGWKVPADLAELGLV